jgi:uncharacterized protein DUF3224
MSRVTGAFQVAGWDEKPYHEGAEGKLTLAIVSQTFSGDVAGHGDARWLMSYRPDGTARFVGLQRVEGEVEGRQGSFVLETAGDFDGKTATWSATVVSGSGTGELSGLEGTGRFGAEHGPEAVFELDLSFG